MFLIICYSTFAIHPWILKYKQEFNFFDIAYKTGFFIYDKYPSIMKDIHNMGLIGVITGYFGLGLSVIGSYIKNRINAKQTVKTKLLVVLGVNFIIVGTILTLIPLLRIQS
jgi:hypothetical protein